MLSPGEIEDGLRALAGRVIRHETYACDEHGSPGAVPFEVTQTSWRLRRLQPGHAAAPAAFSAVKLEDASWTYEQVAGDPRVVHSVVVETDAYDQAVRTARIGYARRAGRPRDAAAQDRHWLAVDDLTLLNVDQPGRYELGVAIDGRSCELVGIRPGTTGLFTRADLRAPQVVAALAAPGPNQVDPPDDPAVGPAARLLSWDRSYFWDDARAAALPLGQLGALTLVHHEEAACFAPAFVADALGGRVDDARLTALGYALREGLWWQVDATHRFGPAAAFSRPVATARSDGAVTQLAYDPYALAAVKATDPVGNVVAATIDYHALAPWRLVDPNGNTAEVRYDPLGVVVAATSYGHAGDQPWGCDPLSAVATRTPADLAAALADPATLIQGAASYLWYEVDAWSRDGTPTTVLRLGREDLVHDGAGDASAPTGRIQTTVAYLDSLGRTLQDKTLVEPGPAIQRDGAGKVVVDAGGRPVLAPAATRWRASGHVVYDAKQRPGRQYEPFFTTTAAFESDVVLQHVGVSTLTRYDATGRVVGQDLPNGTYTRTTYGAWSVVREDPDDTVLDSAYLALREGLPADAPERQALEQARSVATTPVTTFLDPLGRETATLASGGATAADRRTETHLDVEGRPRDVIDPRGLVAFTYRRDMQGRVLAEHGVDDGDAWSLPDAFDRIATTWDGRGFQIDHGHDLADRPIYTDVRGGDGATPMDHRTIEVVYGESLADRADAIRRNLLGRAAIHRDSAGELELDRCDPPGRPLQATRRLRTDVDTEPDWRTAVPLDPDAFITTAVHDALGRPRTDTLADGARRAYEYLPSGPLARVRVTTPDGALVDTPILDGTAYGARGERQAMTLGNGVALAYAYDPDTFRLARQTATRGARTFQDIRTTYDPVGNIVRLTDAAQEGPAGVISGASVPARRDYAYDAHYRLRRATGRVHQALLPHDYIPGTAGTIKGTRHLSLNNGAALERFTRLYDYDPSGNLTVDPPPGRVAQLDHRPLDLADLEPVAAGPRPQRQPRRRPRGPVRRRRQHPRARPPAARSSGPGAARSVAPSSSSAPAATDDAERYVYGADGLRVRKLATRVVHDGQVEVTEKLYLGDAERERVLRGGTVILERWTTHVGDGAQRVALVHRWTRDDLHREVDDITPAPHPLPAHHPPGLVRPRARRPPAASSPTRSTSPTAAPPSSPATTSARSSRKDYRYSGKERDDATGLYYYGYRYFAPWLGRWLSPDPDRTRRRPQPLPVRARGSGREFRCRRSRYGYRCQREGCDARSTRDARTTEDCVTGGGRVWGLAAGSRGAPRRLGPSPAT